MLLHGIKDYHGRERGRLFLFLGIHAALTRNGKGCVEAVVPGYNDGGWGRWIR